MAQKASVCFWCSTNITMLWRSGPEGPSTLCNACGIRYSKMKSKEQALMTETMKKEISLQIHHAHYNANKSGGPVIYKGNPNLPLVVYTIIPDSSVPSGYRMREIPAGEYERAWYENLKKASY